MEMELQTISSPLPPAPGHTGTSSSPPTKNLDSDPSTPSLMQSEQVSWLRSRLPSKLSPLASLGSNLLPDALPPSSPPLLLHPSLSPYCKFLKFLAVVYLGIYASREFAMAHGSTWDEDLDMEEFVSHNLWSTLSDVALI
ncbi:hypothetical protein TrRE_jg1717, partial [Triparma retinervis]